MIDDAEQRPEMIFPQQDWIKFVIQNIIEDRVSVHLHWAK